MVFNLAFIALITFTPAQAEDQKLVRDTDAFHIDIRELVNRTSDAKKIWARADLCAAVEATITDAGGAPKNITCHPLATVGPVAIDGTSAGEPSSVVKFAHGNASGRVLGREINAQAERLRQAVTARDANAGALIFRLALVIEEQQGSNAPTMVERQFAQLPSVDETPATNALIDRHVFHGSANQLRARVLVVISRKVVP